MHSLTPYLVRCHDPNVEPSGDGRQAAILDNVRGHDTWELLRHFVSGSDQPLNLVEETKHAYKFEGVTCDENNRTIYGWMRAGHFGIKSEIVDTETDRTDFEKKPKNAELVNHFFYVFLPRGVNEGIALFHSYRGVGVKTLFSDGFYEDFKEKTGRRLQFNPLSYDKAVQEWLNAQTKEVRLVGFQEPADLADKVKGLGHAEYDLRMKPQRNQSMGKLRELISGDGEKARTVESLQEFCREVRTTVSLNGNTRTLAIGGRRNPSICSILAPVDLEIIDGNPTAAGMIAWCREITEEFRQSIYPGIEM